jgi:hypothetical protein
LWLTFLLSFFPQLAQFYFSRYTHLHFYSKKHLTFSAQCDILKVLQITIKYRMPLWWNWQTQGT